MSQTEQLPIPSRDEGGSGVDTSCGIHSATSGFGRADDDVTAHTNRARLVDVLSAVIQRCSRSRSRAAFLMVAVNNLAMLNETFGHDAGDEVISAVVGALKSRMRGGDTFGRYSANRFGIILHDCGPDAMKAAADRL